MVLEKTPESLGQQGDQTSQSKAEAAILWPPDEKSQLITKDPDDVND